MINGIGVKAYTVSALMLGLTLSLAAHTLIDFAWYSSVIIAIIATVALAVSRLKPLLLGGLLIFIIAQAAGALSLGILNAVAAPERTFTAERVSLFYDNPNLLAASLATSSAIVLLLVRPPYRLPAWFLVLLATIPTGSRLAAASAICGLLVYSFLRYTTVRRAPASSSTKFILGALFILVVLLMLKYSDYNDRNLLRLSGQFDMADWNKDHAEVVKVTPDYGDGPLPNTVSDRVTAVAGESSTLMLFQSAGRSILGEPYVGSIYVRSNRPQQFVLSTHMSKAVCQVSRVWSRCITPVGHGDGTTSVQLRIESQEPNGGLDVELWGAQLERSNIVSSPEIKSSRVEAPIGVLFTRYRIPTFSDLLLSERSRIGAMIAGYRLFWQNPLFGTGLDSVEFETEYKIVVGSTTTVAHTHNVTSQILMTSGVVGVAMWYLVFLAIQNLRARRSATAHQLAPLLIVVIMLNIFDFTFFNAGVLYPFLITLGGSQTEGPSAGAVSPRPA